MKRPYMKFFTSDWRGDPRLRMCSIGARGLWVEMLCLMHEADPYGSLLVNGQHITEKQLATLLGIEKKQVSECIVELECAGVFSRDDDGTIYSRRMRRDAEKSAKNKANGSMGGNPALKPPVNPPDKPSVGEGDKPHIPYSIVQNPEEEKQIGNFRKVGEGKPNGPRHGAVSPSRGTIFIRHGTDDWEAYAEDHRKTHGWVPQPNSHGGHWFKTAGAAAPPIPKRLTA